MKEPQIIVWKKTKRSEKEVDIKPMIYDMHAEDDGIFLFLATGSEQNLKPDLVMEASCASSVKIRRKYRFISTAWKYMRRIRNQQVEQQKTISFRWKTWEKTL